MVRLTDCLDMTIDVDRAPDKRVKGISALIFWKSALKIKLKGKSTLCSLRFQH